MVAGGQPPCFAVERIQRFPDLAGFPAPQQFSDVLQLAFTGDSCADSPGFVDGAPNGFVQGQACQSRGLEGDQLGGEVPHVQGIPPSLAFAYVRAAFGKIFLAFWHSLEEYSRLSRGNTMSDSSMVAQGQLDREAELDALQEHALAALERARGKGASDAEVTAHSSQGLSAGVRLGEVETLEHTQDRGIGVTVYLGRRKGHASSADLRSGSVLASVDRALDIARYTQEDKANGLADPDLLCTEFPDLDLWHPSTMDAGAAIERALACEAAGRRDERISNSEGASFSAGLGLVVYANSHGFAGRSSGTHYGQSCVLLAGEGDGMQRDYSYDSRRSLADLEEPETTGREAAHRTIRRLGARKIKTAEMPVLFAPEVARGLISHLLGAIAGSALYRNASFLRNRAGERLFPDWLRLSERPHLRRGASSSAFDSEGVATRERDIVGAGVLQGYLLSSYSARRLGLKTTANAGGARNVLLAPGGKGAEDPLASLGDGLYVTEVMGQGVSLVTGDYSRGASGFLVEGGKLVHPVEEVTIAGNLENMFRQVVLAGADLDTRGNLHCGSVLISTMMVAGE